MGLKLHELSGFQIRQLKLTAMDRSNMVSQNLTKNNGLGYYYSFDHPKRNSNNAGNRCYSY
jgi:hypothetical protein